MHITKLFIRKRKRNKNHRDNISRLVNSFEMNNYTV